METNLTHGTWLVLWNRKEIAFVKADFDGSFGAAKYP
jgi:hypothetical protein